MSRWAVSLNAVDPNDSSKLWEVGVLAGKIKTLQSAGHISSLARLLLLKETLESPIEIIRGWDRVNCENCWIYVSSPRVDYRSPTIQTPPPKNKSFLVYLLPDGTVCHWAWRQLDSEGKPVDEEREGV